MLAAVAVGLLLVVATATSLVFWLADQLVAQRAGSTWCVYLLFDARGWALYVGMTNDVDRRLGEHRRGGDPWRSRIAGAAVARICRSEAQARRVEARMIRALTVGSTLRVGPPIHNRALFHRRSHPGAYVWFASWLTLSVLFHGCRWHRPNPRRHLERQPETPSERQPINPDLRVERQPETVSPSSQNHPSPVGGRSILDALADAPRPRPLVEGHRRPPRGRPRSTLSAEERAARKRAKDAKAARAYRARKAGR